MHSERVEQPLPSPGSQREQLQAIRATQRRTSRVDMDPFDAFYRVYVTGLIALAGFYFSLGLIDTIATGVDLAAWSERFGSAWIGVGGALLVSGGIRSGLNGGPLTLDEPEIHHLVMSPIPRAVVLHGPVRRLLGVAAAIGSVLGAAVGEIASRQLPGSQAAWVLSGLAAGVAMSLSLVGSALVAAGLTGARRWLHAVSLILPAWAVADLALDVRTSPSLAFGDLALWPLTHRPWAIAGLAATVVVSLLGVWRFRSMSVERAHHRSGLARQIRFAMARQDIRSLLLLRRQLGFETPRRRPWFEVPRNTSFEARFPVLVRDLRSYARWPAARIARVGAIGVVTGLCLAGLWHGATALIALAGGAIYVAAIEVIEPLSQELDHPGMLELIPVLPGGVLVSHLFSGIAAMTVQWTIIGAVATAVTVDWRLAAIIGISAISAAAAAVASAGLSINRFDSPAMVPSPEAEGPRLVLRLLWPPALATSGALPILIARNALLDEKPWLPPTLTCTAIVSAVAVLGLSWIRYRDQMAESIEQAQGTSS